VLQFHSEDARSEKPRERGGKGREKRKREMVYGVTGIFKFQLCSPAWDMHDDWRAAL